ncbi:hypothetical protein LSH36_880g00023 [Paralvinella palmiformis]|uniref:EF-hand domain-containing protein n=1 Tax=Paralvinella palmiformis TaxID=53620 RepID=A0AAD9MRH9_9ANNE|nr:hypothetical protein LSH36_880g00023 [Paralvinella palmiformis]
MSFTRKEITDVFHAFDADKSGQVSSQELVNLFTKLFNNDSVKGKEAAEFVMTMFDTDKSGQISLDEFIKGTEKYINQ